MKNSFVLYFTEKKLRISKENNFMFDIFQKPNHTKLDKLFLLLI